MGQVSGEEYYECVMLKEPINRLLMSGCSVWWLLLGCVFFGSFLESMVIYLCINHRISVSRYCGGGCRKFFRCDRVLWAYWFHSQLEYVGGDGGYMVSTWVVYVRF